METTGSAGFRQCKRNSKGPNVAGTTFLTMNRLGKMFSSAPRSTSGECWTGVHGKAEKLIGFESRDRGDSVRLSPIFVAGNTQ